MPCNDITLNFIPIEPEEFTCHVFSKEYEDNNSKRPFPSAYKTTFFKEGDDGKVVPIAFWLSIDPHDGFSPFSFMSRENPPAATWILKEKITAALKLHFEKFNYEVLVKTGNFHRIYVKIKQSPLGWQGIYCEWAWLPTSKRHGLLMDYHFYKNDEVPFSKEVQKLSLSLNAQNAPNRDYYSDKFNWVYTFKNKVLLSFVDDDQMFDDQIIFAREFISVPSHMVATRHYEFFGMRSGDHQYSGIKKYGPYQKITDQPTFFFVFREKDRSLARFLYTCLIGKEFPAKFSGLYSFFKVPFGSSNTKHEVLDDFSIDSLELVAQNIINTQAPNPVAIVLVEGDDDSYNKQKAIFLKYKIPSQDVTIGTLTSGSSFQWSVAGLALQLFCKSGGLPWCVQTKRKNSLIIGISQLWDDPGKGNHRYVAYSVTTDASGIFKDINTLSNQTTEDDYIEKLTKNLRASLFSWVKKEDFSRIVLHCSFRLKKKTMTAIRDVVKEICEESLFPQIVIMRINTKHQYFGYDLSRQSHVPNECTFVKLGRGKYLLWCDGLRDGQTISGRPSAPIYVCFDSSIPESTYEAEVEMIEDLSNLAGANWRGFNAKTRPVSVFYCDLVGGFIKNFTERDLPVPEIEQFTPWFL